MEEFFSDRLFTALERNEPTAGMVLVAAPGMLSGEFGGGGAVFKFFFRRPVLHSGIS